MLIIECMYIISDKNHLHPHVMNELLINLLNHKIWAETKQNKPDEHKSLHAVYN